MKLFQKDKKKRKEIDRAQLITFTIVSICSIVVTVYYHATGRSFKDIATFLGFYFGGMILIEIVGGLIIWRVNKHFDNFIEDLESYREYLKVKDAGGTEEDARRAYAEYKEMRKKK